MIYPLITLGETSGDRSSPVLNAIEDPSGVFTRMICRAHFKVYVAPGMKRELMSYAYKYRRFTMSGLLPYKT